MLSPRDEGSGRRDKHVGRSFVEESAPFGPH